MKNTTTGLWLDAILGLFGLIGIGEVFLGKRLIGELLFTWTGRLYTAILQAFTHLSPLFYLLVGVNKDMVLGDVALGMADLEISLIITLMIFALALKLSQRWAA